MRSRGQDTLVTSGAQDAELLEAIAARDQSAFEDLFQKYADPIARFAWALTRDTDAAQELVQDTFFTLWNKPDRVSLVNGSVLPWLITSCRHHFQNRRRREAKWSVARSLDDLQIEPAASTEGRELLEWALASIDSMSDLDREVCQLCMLEGLSYREAATQLSISQASVGKRLHRARLKIRRDINS